MFDEQFLRANGFSAALKRCPAAELHACKDRLEANCGVDLSECALDLLIAVSDEIVRRKHAIANLRAALAE